MLKIIYTGSCEGIFRSLSQQPPMYSILIYQA